MTLSLLEQIAARELELSSGKHSPTSAMKTVATRGLRIAKQQKTDMDPVALNVGRKIASGAKLSSDHVEAMASYHAAHDGACPTGTDETSCEDMLWGGSPGASWSGARMAALDVTDLAQAGGRTMLALEEEGKGVALEVFVRDGMGEKLELGDDDLIWAPILRSGMLATRPGPNGEKRHEPLVFVPGLASDPRKEIGLQNLVDSFKKNAIQHVTIPTSHDNSVLSNTGFIKDLKIVDSKRRPGEKVILAAHDFRDPAVREKVKLGTIANRSCGIVYDHVNTETGETFEQAIDHVALTNKPWVTGMAAYGDAGEEDFADREVISLMLSEAPGHGTSLADVSSGSWDGSASRFTDQQWARSCVLDRGTGSGKDRYSLPIREPDGTLNASAVSSAAGRIGSVKGASLAQKKAAARALIAAYSKIGDKPPTSLLNLVRASTNMSAAERADLNLADVLWGDELSLGDLESQVVSLLSEFGDPEEVYPIYRVMDVTPTKALVRCSYGDPDGTKDAWVIPLEVDGTKVNLADYSQWTPVEQQWVTDEDAAQDKQELGSILGTTELSDERKKTSSNPTTPLKGGAMKPTIQEVLGRLDLSDEVRAALTPMLEENEQLRTHLAEQNKQARITATTQRVKELQGKGFSPGFLKRYEEIALGDDGDVAATLNLSEDGKSTGEREYTATAIADSLIAALPLDDSGKLALADTGHLLTSPIGDRPPVDAADQERVEEKQGKKPPTADEWLAEANKVAPGIGEQHGLHLSTEKKEG